MSNELRAALATAVVTFLTLFAASAVGFVGQLQEWADTGGEFPDVSVLGRAAVSAALAALAGLVNYAYRWLQARGALPGSGPVYPSVKT